MTITTISKIALLCGTCLAIATPALAQDEQTDAAQASATSGNDVIVVTGTQIRGAQIDDVLPVTVVDQDDIEAINPASGDELFRAIP